MFLPSAYHRSSLGPGDPQAGHYWERTFTVVIIIFMVIAISFSTAVAPSAFTWVFGCCLGKVSSHLPQRHTKVPTKAAHLGGLSGSNNPHWTPSLPPPPTMACRELSCKKKGPASF